MEPGNASKIAQLNDEFRKSFKNTVMTPGVVFLDDVLGLTGKVYEFNNFPKTMTRMGNTITARLIGKGSAYFGR